jgi:molecular chaperone DnaJ
VQIEKHPVFEREEDDLVCELPLNFAQVALGDEVVIPTFGDDLDFMIPPGTQSGEVFIVPGKGMPKADNGSFGDLRVTVRVITPGNLSQRQKDILRELRKSLEQS